VCVHRPALGRAPSGRVVDVVQALGQFVVVVDRDLVVAVVGQPLD
jgi:hypothetical protein